MLSNRDAAGLNGEAQAYAEKVTAFVKEKCCGDPKQIMAGYDIRSGRALADYSNLRFTAPLMISAAAHQGSGCGQRCERICCFAVIAGSAA